MIPLINKNKWRHKRSNGRIDSKTSQRAQKSKADLSLEEEAVNEILGELKVNAKY